MSNHAQLALCQPLGGSTPGQLPISDLQFWRVLDMGDRILMCAQAPEPAASLALREAAELLRLEARMLQLFSRLQEAERAISLRARRRPGGGSTAVRLIEMERQRIALELHTGVGQMLAAIRLQLEIVSAHFPDPPALVRSALDHIGELADGALQQVRSVSQRLQPPEWQRLSLPAALQQLWVVSGIPQKFAGSLQIETELAEPALQVKVLLYRAAQEALSNLLRHSRASRVDGVLQLRANRLVLTIADDGIGFHAAASESPTPSAASGMGLRSIKELAAELGGDLAIETGPAGTKLAVSVPCFLSGQ